MGTYLYAYKYEKSKKDIVNCAFFRVVPDKWIFNYVRLSWRFDNFSMTTPEFTNRFIILASDWTIRVVYHVCTYVYACFSFYLVFSPQSF